MEASASLRKGTLYVKMPREKVILLIEALTSVKQDLIRKEILESRKAFVFYGSTDDWNEDLVTLEALGDLGIIRETPSLSIVVKEFITAVKAGLRNEAEVDWILRIGGPPRETRDVLESLSEGPEEIFTL
jgi:hypothetical protein